MTPMEFKKYAVSVRREFFAKFPKPSRNGPRAFWKQTMQHANNALEDNDWLPETFAKAKEKIEFFMKG